VRLYYVPTDAIDDATLERLRHEPDLAQLADLAHVQLGDWMHLSDPQAQAAADGLLNGRLQLPGHESRNIALPFAAKDVEEGSASSQLVMGSLALVDALTQAYVSTHDERYFSLATRYLLGWASFERRAWLPHGFLWDDHAVAARVPVLARFWGVYRSHPDFDASNARLILQAVTRTARMLAKPDLFTARTNHGVAQNLALLHVAAAFPALPDAGQYADLAVARLQRQFEFYLSPEGVVLEHSAGYHEFGVELLGYAFDYLRVLRRPVPADWRARYRDARAFYLRLRRPDDTLPTFGNTFPEARRPPPLSPAAIEALADSTAPVATFPSGRWLYPVSGYAIWNDDASTRSAVSSQVVTVWANFATRAHKHADELGVLFWAGRDWWVHVGYFPSASANYESAIGWSGSNAPHMATESADEARSSKVAAYANAQGLDFLDLERGASAVRARRQLMQLGSGVWLVLDEVQGAGTGIANTIWTAAPQLRVKRDADLRYRLLPPAGHPVLQVMMNSNAPIAVRELRGSRSPYAGWVAWDRTETRVRQTSSLLVEFRPGQPMVTAWTVLPQEIAVALTDWADSKHWRLELTGLDGMHSISRDDDSVISANGPGRERTVRLIKPVDVTGSQRNIDAAYRRLESSYPHAKDLLPWRVRVTWVLIAAWLLQALVFAALAYLLPREACARINAQLQWAGMFCWILGGAWLLGFYLRG